MTQHPNHNPTPTNPTSPTKTKPTHNHNAKPNADLT